MGGVVGAAFGLSVCGPFFVIAILVFYGSERFVLVVVIMVILAVIEV